MDPKDLWVHLDLLHPYHLWDLPGRKDRKDLSGRKDRKDLSGRSDPLSQMVPKVR
jgi:hypothetical protein